jgi:hypothetical protein
MNMREAAQEALTAQDAVNLSGVLRSFAEIVSEVIWPEARRLGLGTSFVNEHPICTLFLVKLSDLNGGEAEYSRAYDAVRKLATE